MERQPELTGLELGQEQRLQHEVAQTARANARGERLRGQRFRVLLALVDLCQGRPEWSGSLAQLADQAGVGSRTAQAAIADARELLFVVVTRRPGQTSIYAPQIAAILDHCTALGEAAAATPVRAGSLRRRRRAADPAQLQFPFDQTPAAAPCEVRTRSRIVRDLAAEFAPVRKIARVIALVLEFVHTFRRAESAETTPELGAPPAQVAGVTRATGAVAGVGPAQVAGVTPTTHANAGVPPAQVAGVTPTTHANAGVPPAQVAGVTLETPANAAVTPRQNGRMHDHEHGNCLLKSSMTMAPDPDKAKGDLGEKDGQTGGLGTVRKPISAGGKSLQRSDLANPSELQRLWDVNRDRLGSDIARIDFFALAATLGPLAGVSALKPRNPIAAFFHLLDGKLLDGRDWRSAIDGCAGARQRAEGWLAQLDRPAQPQGWEAGEAWLADQRRRQAAKKQLAGVP
jgi:hypothetical protein